MSTGIGALETIANSLTMCLSTLKNIDEKLNHAGLDSVGDSFRAGGTPNTTDEDETPTQTRGKKTAAKKTASKKTAAKKKASALADITVFKKALFDAADASGISDVMPKAKAFIKSRKYGSSDEIEVEDREQFLEDLKEHFAELAESEGDESDEDDGIDL